MQLTVKRQHLANCAECSYMLGYRRAMPGEKGWRSPHPEWWVEAANDRLRRRQLDRKGLARLLGMRASPISEMMVLRALHPDASKRVATIETLNAISDALRLPRPVVVAATLAQALELHMVVSLDAADADILRISNAVDRENDLQPTRESAVDGADGGKTNGAVDKGRARAAERRPRAVRRTPRAR